MLIENVSYVPRTILDSSYRSEKTNLWGVDADSKLSKSNIYVIVAILLPQKKYF